MKKSLLSIVGLAGLWYGVAVAGELCQRNNIEFVMEEARRQHHVAQDVLFKYEYYAKELLTRQSNPTLDQCVHDLLQPIRDGEREIVLNKVYDDMPACEKYEQISISAKAFTRRYGSNMEAYFQNCLNNNPGNSSKPATEEKPAAEEVE